MTDFCEQYDLSSLISEPTCYKNPDNPSCIDLILTNRPRSFQNSCTIETGLSDFHKMTITVLKSTFKKLPPKLVHDRNYGKFCNDKFMAKILNKNAFENTLEDFIEMTLDVLNSQAPLRKKILRGNQQPFMNKELNKAVMKRSNLRTKFIKSRTDENKTAYNKQRNYCVNLFRNEKKKYFGNLDLKKVIDNKKFWRTVKPLLSDKIISSEKITLIEGDDEHITDEKQIAVIFNKFFTDIVPSLNLKISSEILTSTKRIHDPVLKSIKKFEKHPGILIIKTNVSKNDIFSFATISISEIEKELTQLDSSKACLESDIPTKVIKENSKIFSTIIGNSFNESLETGYFPDKLKKANITAAFKNEERTCKNNYRPISTLSNLSKVFERIMYRQISKYFERFFSKFQCGFRKNHSAQNCLIYMLEIFKGALDKHKHFGALLTDLSKAFDCIPHDLLIAKLHAYGLDYKSLKLVHSYLHNRKQRVKVGDSFSSWAEILFGVPQGSILGPLLFNIFICDLFYFLRDEEIANYADDTTPFTTGDTIEIVVAKNKEISDKFFTWLENNAMKGNADKCHLILSSKKEISFTIKDKDIKSSSQKKLLGVTIDNDLSFSKHVTNLCNKASSKLSALARVSSYMTLLKKKITMKAFITSQFSYCPLVWMLHSRRLNARIDRLHERSLRVVYNDKSSSFHELLDKDKSVKIHHKNLQYLAI